MRIIGLTLAIAILLLHPSPIFANNADIPEAGYGQLHGENGYGVFETGVRFVPRVSPPFACAPARDGFVSMTAAHRLCVCDGKAWLFENDGQPCQWGKP